MIVFCMDGCREIRREPNLRFAFHESRLTEILEPAFRAFDAVEQPVSSIRVPHGRALCPSNRQRSINNHFAVKETRGTLNDKQLPTSANNMPPSSFAINAGTLLRDTADTVS